MVFRRRTPLTWTAWAKGQVYPVGGFKRATMYLWHRLRRLPDPPHRIARGVFAGTFVNFPPIFGLQMVSAAAMAWVMRGNILAAVLGTFLSNPVTTPIIAAVSIKLGYWMLGMPGSVGLNELFSAFGMAGGELWHNFLAIFGPGETHWTGLANFWHRIYWPYTVGSILPGILTSLAFYWLTLPTLTAYQALRRRRLAARIAALRKKVAAKEGDGPPINL
ncbi:MAG: DUF2062 domain-containing protein [Candidatus Saccharibacteria bacterium]|nr:DUF2062 domain-containing protein [Pseudorhodobacter sp.]